jgi:hypothetical protein
LQQEVSMPFRFLTTLGLLVALTAAAGAQDSQFQLFANISDSTGAPGTAVQPENIRVSENGAAATVAKVEPINWPVKLQLLVDNGIGLGAENLLSLRNGLRGLLEALPKGAEVTIVTTAPQPRFLVRATTDREALLQGLGRLAPDSGAGRFVESMAEAAQRIERDKTDQFPVIISVATTSGDTNVADRDINRLMERLEARTPTVHVVLIVGPRTASGGALQTDVGLAVTKYTRGRFENINAGSRLETLLPELGADVAKSYPEETNKFRITVERPAGAKGDLGKITMGTTGGFVATNISMAPR